MDAKPAIWERLTDCVYKLEERLGINRNESLVSLVVISGLLIGATWRWFNHELPAEQEKRRFIASFDSVIAAEEKRQGRPLEPVLSLKEAGRREYGLHGDDTTTVRSGGAPATFQTSDKIAKDDTTTKINIQTANAEQLQRIPGIGPATAQRIIEYRTNNAFTRPEDLMEVKGIGPKKFEQMSKFITLSR